MVITSVSNEKVKSIRSLSQKKYRDRENLFIAEGIKMVNEAIKANLKIKTVCVTEGVKERIHATDAEVLTVSESVFKSMSNEISPEGALAVIEKPCLQPKQAQGNSLLLDGLKDPGNIGTIIRTAAAAGYKDIYLLETADPFNPKTVRSSMSGIYFVNLYSVTKEDFSLYAKNVIVADMQGENLFDFKPNGNFCLAIGSESNGVSKEVLSVAKAKISIPMEKHSESLNAGVAAGISMYVLNHQKN